MRTSIAMDALLEQLLYTFTIASAAVGLGMGLNGPGTRVNAERGWYPMTLIKQSLSCCSLCKCSTISP